MVCLQWALMIVEFQNFQQIYTLYRVNWICTYPPHVNPIQWDAHYLSNELYNFAMSKNMDKNISIKSHAIKMTFNIEK